MYFRLVDDTIEECGYSDWSQSENAIAIYSINEWNKISEFKDKYFLRQQNSIHFCKLECFSDYLFGTLRIPQKKKNDKSEEFFFYIFEKKLVFIDDTGMVMNSIRKILTRKHKKGYTLEQFLYDFLVSIIDEDFAYLQEIEKEISKIEEGILSGKIENFNYRMLHIKKEILRFHRYYNQLTELGLRLKENEIEFFGKDKIATFRVFAERAARLQSETQMLREYAMQVQEVYQSEIGIRQNDVMKVLTIVTAIFLPLTLIVGWYGMNFSNMPELSWPYGYPLVCILSAVTVILSLWFIKIKKFW